MSETKTGVATFVKQRNGNGDGRVYRVEPPIEQTDYNGNVTATYDHVWVSAVDNSIAGYQLIETYIFGSDADGEVLDWSELDGSFKGRCDHEEALRGAGYEVQA